MKLTFTTAGAEKWTALTRESVFNEGSVCRAVELSPDNRNVCMLAIVVGNAVVSAPAIHGVMGSTAEFSGLFSEKDAKLMAARLRFGAGIPAGVTHVEAVSTKSSTRALS